LSASGNLNFTGTGNRITGDFSNATFANRVAFQSSTTNGNTDIQVLPNGTSVISGIRLNGASDPTNSSYARLVCNTTSVDLLSDRNSGSGTYLPMTFYTGGSERVRIDTSGNVGIGVTPSAWDSDRKPIQLGSGGNINGSVSLAPFVEVGANFYTGSGPVDRYLTTGVATKYRQVNGAHQWSYAASGTAGNAITFTQAMTLDASGNLLVGTTSQNGIITAVGSSQISHKYTGSSSVLFIGQYNSSGDASINNTANGPLLFATNNTERARIDSSGNVGIGTSTINNRLEVSGRVRASTGLIAVDNLWLGSGEFYLGAENGTTDDTWRMYPSSGNLIYASRKSGTWTERMRIDGSGNVGIGTTNPGADLDVVKTTAGYVIGRWQNNDQGSSSFAMLTVNAYGNSWGMRMGTIAANSNRLDFVEDANGARTPRLSIAVGGNVGIGTTSPSNTLQVANGSASQMRLSEQTLTYYYDFGRDNSDGFFSINGNQGLGYKWKTAGAERMRLDGSGNLLVGTTSGSYKVTIQESGSGGISLITASSAATMIRFQTSSGLAGYIDSTGTSTNYATSSDYRLKENLVPLSGSGDFIDALKPKSGTWKADGSKFVGFIAHEFAEVCPSAVKGEKDAVDENGEPLYQGMQASTSEVIANLVAELQSLRQRVATLESK
jgi:hypothetical protein